jgi:hypothetical protein
MPSSVRRSRTAIFLFDASDFDLPPRTATHSVVIRPRRLASGPAPCHPPTAGFAQPVGFGGAEQCSAKPRLRPPSRVRRLIGSLRSKLASAGAAVSRQTVFASACT